MYREHDIYTNKKGVGSMVKYKVVVRFLGKANLRSIRTGKLEEVIVENPELVRIVPFPAPESGTFDAIGIYEFVPIKEEKKEE